MDISDASIEIADIRQRFGIATLRAIHRAELKPGIVEDGVIRDIDALAKTISQCCLEAEPGPIKNSAAFFAAPESKVFTHVFTFPRDLDKKAVKEAIDVQFSEYFPFDIEQTAYDWKVVQVSDQTQMILVAACDRRYIEQLVALADKLDMKVAGVDIESVSTARAILPPVKDLDSHMLIDLGANVTSMSIFGEEGLQCTFALDIGGKKMTHRIAGKKNASEAQAEQMLRNLNFNKAKQSKEDQELIAICASLLKPVIEESRRIIRFYEGSRKKTVSKIYLCGGMTLIKGLAGYIQEQVDLSVKIGDAGLKIKNKEVLENNKEALLFANVIGLALGGADKKYLHSRYEFLKSIS
ncbi:MAG: pilus assembly protein PilM [Candidatus Kerfeldbacteria bacterium]